MSAIRKQLQWDESTDMWPITDASAVHYTYNPEDTNAITSPVSGTSYGLDNYLNGLLGRFMTQDLIAAIATNINKGPGILYNSASNITAVAIPSAGTSNAFLKVTYTNAGALSLTFDTNTYMLSSVKYAGSASQGGSATSAVKLDGGAKGNLVYQSGSGATAFLANGSSGKLLGWDATNGLPIWVSAENYTTSTMINNKAFALTDNSWISTSTDNTSANLPTTAGTYALLITDSSYGSYTGVFVVDGSSGKIEEIPLHWCSKSGTTEDTHRIYAATQSGKLVLSAASSENHTLTIKYKRII